ncbi:MAG: hypothetical protein ACRC62_15620 [Microcoleus sp.]
MSRFINNINSDATRVPDNATSGWWTVTTDPSTVGDGKTVLQQWVDLLTLIQRLSADQKTAALEALGLSDTDLIKLIQDNSSDTSLLSEIALDDITGDIEKQWRDTLGITYFLERDRTIESDQPPDEAIAGWRFWSRIQTLTDGRRLHQLYERVRDGIVIERRYEFL